MFGTTMKCVHTDVGKAAGYRNLELRELVRVGEKLASWRIQMVLKAMGLGQSPSERVQDQLLELRKRRSQRRREKTGIKGIVIEIRREIRREAVTKDEEETQKTRHRPFQILLR